MRLAYAAYLLLLLALTELGALWSGLDLRLLPKLLYYQTALPGLHQPDPDPELVYRLRSQGRALDGGLVFTTNTLGLRGPERGPTKPAGVVRVACLGGSNTFGAAVRDDQTYPALLEKTLNARFRGHFEVWNAGLCASVLGQNVAQAEELLARHDPDVLIFQRLNTGRRAFLPGQDYRPAFRKDPDLWLENIRFLPFAGQAWGPALLRRCALWRALVVGLNHLTALPVNNPRFNSDEPNQRKFLEFWRRRRGSLPILVLESCGSPPLSAPGWPDDVAVLDLGDRKALPELPYREYLFSHPPACGYRWYAAVLARRLAQALPGTFRRGPGPLPEDETCRTERDLLPGSSPGRAIEVAGENERARGLLAAMARQAGGDAGLWTAYADAAAAGRQPDEARAALSHAEALQPSGEVLWAVAEVHAALGEHADALRALTALTARPPVPARYWVSRAAAAARCGRPAEARRALSQAARPGAADLARMAGVYLELHEESRAAELLGRLRPSAAQPALACAEAAARAGLRARALRCLAEATATSPQAQAFGRSE